jgi:hypothetical protein
LRGELVVHVVLGEVGLVLEDQAEYEDEPSEDQPTGREDDVERATCICLTPCQRVRSRRSAMRSERHDLSPSA